MAAEQLGVVTLNPNGQTANVSVPEGDADGFDACWGTMGRLSLARLRAARDGNAPGNGDSPRI